VSGAHQVERGILSQQRGVTLVVVLLFMLALTALVLFSARSALMGESLARNQLDERQAREAAESALRDAEQDIFWPDSTQAAGADCGRGEARPLVGKDGHFTPDCRAGQCTYTNQDARLGMNYSKASAGTKAQSEVWWPISKGGRWNEKATDSPPKGNCSTFTGGVPLGTFTGQPALKGVSRQPEYLIELVRKNKESYAFYRVTARGFGVREGTEIVLQSYVKVQE
jgi:type IV pilus assembly protein PilX